MRLRPLLAVLAVQLPLAAAAQEPQEPLERCLFFSGTSDSIRKASAVEESLEGLREVIDKWKLENGIVGPVTETPQRPEPKPYWRSSISEDLFLTPDIVSDTAYTLCWKGVVSPVVCTSGSKVCW
jgi:hypothetical protein